MTLLLSLVGMLALMFIAWLASENRRAIRWRTVLGALALQTGF
ncbi:MAG: Na+ dependent nucleoside transporter N-terminal domain-containing protein, partial [Aeromonas veronii]